MATAEQYPDAIRHYRACSRSWFIERVPAEPEPGPTRLAAPRAPASGFRPGWVTVPRAGAEHTSGSWLWWDRMASADLLPGDPDRRERQHPRAADRECGLPPVEWLSRSLRGLSWSVL